MQATAKLISIGENLRHLDNFFLNEHFKHDQSLLIDVSEVKHTSPSCLNSVLKTQQHLQHNGYNLALISPSAYLRTWLYVTKLHPFIPSFPNLALANSFIQASQNKSTNQY